MIEKIKERSGIIFTLVFTLIFCIKLNTSEYFNATSKVVDIYLKSLNNNVLNDIYLFFTPLILYVLLVFFSFFQKKERINVDNIFVVIFINLIIAYTIVFLKIKIEYLHLLILFFSLSFIVLKIERLKATVLLLVTLIFLSSSYIFEDLTQSRCNEEQKERYTHYCI